MHTYMVTFLEPLHDNRHKVTGIVFRYVFTCCARSIFIVNLLVHSEHCLSVLLILYFDDCNTVIFCNFMDGELQNKALNEMTK